MKKCYIKLVNRKWHVIDENGMNWCAFDIGAKSMAIDCAKAKGFTEIIED